MSSIAALKQLYADIDALQGAEALMAWDQQVFMPPGSAGARAAHLGCLLRMSHELFTSDKMQRLIEEAAKEAEPGTEDAATVRVLKRALDQRTKIPATLVEEKGRLGTLGHEIWAKARQDNDFGHFAPILGQLIELTKQEGECLGYTDHIYDALTDQYEEGATKKSWDHMFDGIRKPIVELVAAIKEAGPVDDSALYGDWPEADQRAFCDHIARAVGFDFNIGRQDTAVHPFCGGPSTTDVRLTTRFKNYLPSAIMGTLHEAGHGMYEQGTPVEWAGSPLAGGVSLGWHESQSRTWENIVGRSHAFWTFMLPKLHEAFPATKAFDADSFVKLLNKVEPSFIRVEADEVTYSLHIMVRFEIECALMDGSLAVKDLPEFWNEKYRSYLGIVPETDSVGCLQDVHWSAGAFGYFPTYAMGSILSYQVFDCLRADLGDVDAMMAKGEFAPILHWLQEKVYRQGKRYTPADLVQRVTGKAFGPEAYIAGISAKYKALYGI
ncbi:MAG: carboxypeptidase M32 [Armatimonadetes bacterium]|nr:carboxypeptidase M32 [Armatimonadota bacterium]